MRACTTRRLDPSLSSYFCEKLLSLAWRRWPRRLVRRRRGPVLRGRNAAWSRAVQARLLVSTACKDPTCRMTLRARIHLTSVTDASLHPRSLMRLDGGGDCDGLQPAPWTVEKMRTRVTTDRWQATGTRDIFHERLQA